MSTSIRRRWKSVSWTRTAFTPPSFPESETSSSAAICAAARHRAFSTRGGTRIPRKARSTPLLPKGSGRISSNGPAPLPRAARRRHPTRTSIRVRRRHFQQVQGARAPSRNSAPLFFPILRSRQATPNGNLSAVHFLRARPVNLTSPLSARNPRRKTPHSRKTKFRAPPTENRSFRFTTVSSSSKPKPARAARTDPLRKDPDTV